MDKNLIGKRLRRQRENFGLTREKFSEKVDISPQFLAELENGKKGMSAETIYKICSVFPISADYLLFGKETISNESSPVLDILSSLTEPQKNMLEELFELEWEEITDCLDEIETLSDFAEQVEEEKSLSHTIVNILGDTAIEMLESWVDEKRKERDEVDKAETDAIFEALYDIKNTLTLLIDSFKEVINTEIDLNDEEEVLQYFICLAICAAAFGSQYFSEEDWIELSLEEITGQDFYTAQEGTFEFLEFLDSVFDEFEEDAIDFEKVSLKMASRLFAHKIDTILEEFQEDDADVEELYQTGLNEAKILREQLKKVRRNINKIIEYGYKEQQELFCE